MIFGFKELIVLLGKYVYIFKLKNKIWLKLKSYKYYDYYK